MDLGVWRERCGDKELWSEKILSILFKALVESNRVLLRCKKIPRLYQSGVRYQREPPGQEVWKGIEGIMRDRWGDCEDLAAWRVSELLELGERASGAFKKKRRGRHTTYHVVVRREDGTIEDPSRKLGMGEI